MLFLKKILLLKAYPILSYNQTNSMFKLKHFFYLQAIINFCSGVCMNRPSLKTAARRMSAPIWSVRYHPIYQLIEVTDEAQMLCLKPGIRNLVKRTTVLFQSRYLNQNKSLDSVLEEINMTLKT